MNLDKESWDLPSNHFSHIRAIDLFEHLENPINFIEEVYRIAVDDATVEIRGPHRTSQNWSDPTHKRLLGVKTFPNFFTADGTYNFYSDAKFDVEEIRLLFMKRPYFPWNHICELTFNRSRKLQKLFEVTVLSRVFPAQHVYFRLDVKK